MAPWILSHFPEHKIYTEAFGGGGSVLLRKPRAPIEVYNDLDDRMVNLFRVLRDNGDELRRRIELTPYSRTEFFEAIEPALDPIEAARRVVVRCTMGFSSNSLNNNSDGFKSKHDLGHRLAHYWCNKGDAVSDIAKRMQGVLIENRDAISVIQEHDSSCTLHYVDPPYLGSTRVSGNYCHDMKEDSRHEELLSFLTNVKGMVALSGYRSGIYDSILFGWTRIDNPCRSLVSERLESLWLNPRCSQQCSLFDPPTITSAKDAG
jgi:DNA adenine methylase